MINLSRYLCQQELQKMTADSYGIKAGFFCELKSGKNADTPEYSKPLARFTCRMPSRREKRIFEILTRFNRLILWGIRWDADDWPS